MAVIFPQNPTPGQVYLPQSSSIGYTWTGYFWDKGVVAYTSTGSATITVSYVNANNISGVVPSASLATTSSISSNSINANTASFVDTARTASLLTGTASQAITASYIVTAQTASYVVSALTASFVDTSLTASFVNTARTASFVDTARTSSFITASNVSGIVAQSYTASYIVTAQTASYIVTAQTASLLASTASQAFTASYVVTAQTASRITGSNVVGIVAQSYTASFVDTARTASYVVTALTASYFNTSSLATIGSNNFVGNQNINGSVNITGSVSILTTAPLQIGSGSGNEGGEINLAYAQTTSLTGSFVVVDIYQDKFRIFENGGNARGISIDLSKAPSNSNGEITWKASGLVNAGTDVTLGNLKARIASSGNRSLQVSTVTGTYSVYGSSIYSTGAPGGTSIADTAPLTITTTPGYLNAGYHFTIGGYTDTWLLMSTANTIAWRITMIMGASYNNNMVSIERLV